MSQLNKVAEMVPKANISVSGPQIVASKHTTPTDENLKIAQSGLKNMKSNQQPTENSTTQPQILEDFLSLSTVQANDNTTSIDSTITVNSGAEKQRPIHSHGYSFPNPEWPVKESKISSSFNKESVWGNHFIDLTLLNDNPKVFPLDNPYMIAVDDDDVAFANVFNQKANA